MKIYAAPLQGFTEAPWRNAHERIFGGIDAYFAPFMRLEKSQDDKLPVRNKDIRDIAPENNSVACLVPQVIASGAEEFRTLTDVLAGRGYKWIDINMGCPFPLLTKRHKGCGILPYPEEVEEIMKQTEKYADIQFSVKMRLGCEDSDEWRNILPILNDTKLKMITLHPRIGRQQYKGDVDMNGFEAFMQECKHRLVYNGDITTVGKMQDIAEKYPMLEGIMTGRGLLARPSLASEFINGNETGADELCRKVMTMHDELYTHYESRLQGDTQLLNKMKCFWEYMEPTIGKKNYKGIKKSINLMKYRAAIKSI